MRHAGRASCLAPAAQQEALAPSVWISDTQLASAYDRFSRCFRRHGSSVPGPLEARRRAVKRRNAHLASVEARPPNDGDVLLTSQTQTQVGWWQSNNTSTATPYTAPKSFLGLPVPIFAPSWSSKPPPPPPMQVRGRPPALSDMEEGTSTRKSIGSVLFFTSQLKAVATIEELRKLFGSLRLSSAQKGKCSELALAHVLRAQWNLEALQEFVFDVSLNIPGCENYNLLARQLTKPEHTLARKLQLVDVICRSISVGLVSTSDIRLAVQQLWNASIFEGQLDEAPSVHKLHLRVINAIQASSVISLEDLGRPFLELWFTKVENAQFDPSMVEVLQKLQRFGQKSDIDLSADGLCRWFEFWVEDAERRPEVMPLSSFMYKLPRTSWTPALLQATERIVHLVKENHYEADVMAQWHTLLSNLEDSIVAILFPKTNPTWSQSLQRSSTGLSDHQRMLLLCWIATSVCSLNEKRAQLLKNAELHVPFVRVCSTSTDSDHADVLAQVFYTLQTLPLPHADLLLQDLRHITHGFLVVRASPKKLDACFRQIPGRGFHLLQNDVDYKNIQRDFSGTLIRIAESVNSDLPRFLQIARELIAQDKLAFRIITRILRHNRALHNALSQSHPARVEHHAQSPVFRLKLPNLPSSLQSLPPRQVLHTIHQLAFSFATSPAVSPRLAFLKVYWCYLLLHRYGAPIEPPMTRALWHAGVTRYVRAGTGLTTARLRWILELVKQVEGREVARRLVHSASYRKEAEEALNQVLGGSKIRKKCDERQPGLEGMGDVWMNDMDEWDDARHDNVQDDRHGH